MKTRKFSNSDYNAGDTVIIYGASIGAELIFQCLKELNIPIAFFCDRRKAGGKLCNLQIENPEILRQYPNAKVIIVVTRAYASVFQYLESLKFDIVYNALDLLKDKGIEDFQYDISIKNEVLDFIQSYPIYISDNANDNIILPALEVFITEKCTLHCKDCSHLIPYYRNPKNHDMDKTITSLKMVLKIVDKIHDLIILGGEPFLHPELGRLLEFCNNIDKIKNITIITNATVLPERELLRIINNTETRIRMSDYGKYSVKMKEIENTCRERSINCYINRELWTDMGKIENHNYSDSILKEIFMDCPFTFSTLIINGKLFRCAHVAHIHELGIIKNYEKDYIDLSQPCVEIHELRKRFKEYMEVDSLFGCNFCNGIKNSVTGIEPGIQLLKNENVSINQTNE